MTEKKSYNHHGVTVKQRWSDEREPKAPAGFAWGPVRRSWAGDFRRRLFPLMAACGGLEACRIYYYRMQCRARARTVTVALVQSRVKMLLFGAVSEQKPVGSP